jgi:predicted amidophosphoribosyltransferase
MLSSVLLGCQDNSSKFQSAIEADCQKTSKNSPGVCSCIAENLYKNTPPEIWERLAAAYERNGSVGKTFKSLDLGSGLQFTGALQDTLKQCKE